MSTKSKTQASASAIEPNRLYTYAEAAELFGVTDRQVRRWVEEGKLDYTVLPAGRGRRISGQQYIDTIRNSAVAASN
jgi:excisionase family DNA binding protein